MNRLQLCQKLYRILRIGNERIGSGPTTTIGQSAQELEIVSFIDDAYQTIQTEQPEWSFRVKQGTFPLVNGTRVYSRATIQATITDYDQWLALNGWASAHFLIYKTSTGVSDQTPCYYLPYERFRGTHDRNTVATGKPMVFTERPDRSLEFDGTPDADYTATIDYRRTLHVMTTDSDATTGTPIIPEAHHDAIVYLAARNYCDTRDNSEELYKKMDYNYRREMLRLRTEHTPEPLMRLDVFYNPA